MWLCFTKKNLCKSFPRSFGSPGSSCAKGTRTAKWPWKQKINNKIKNWHQDRQTGSASNKKSKETCFNSRGYLCMCWNCNDQNIQNLREIEIYFFTTPFKDQAFFFSCFNSLFTWLYEHIFPFINYCTPRLVLTICGL